MTMKYPYNNKLTILCVCLFLLLSVASCTDEEIGSRLPKDGELVEMTFILNVAQTEDVALTRAVTSENAVTELTLLVFPSQEGTAKLEQIQQVSEFTETNNSYRFTIQLEASASEKYIYIVANANDKLTDISKESTTLADVRAITSNVVSGETNLVMSGVKQSAIPGIGLVAEDFVLNRNTAKVTVKNAEGISLRLGEFQLRNGSEEGQILAGADATNAPRDTATIQQSDPTKPLYTYPSSSASQPFLVVSGTDNGVTSWYRINLKNAEGSYFSLLPNHHYEVTITKVNGKGYDSADEAAKHDPSGIEAEIYDHQPTVYNMITDGSQELGVSDTIEIGAQADTTAEFSIKYYPGTPTDLTVEIDNASTSWLELDNNGKPTATTMLDDGKETGTLYTYRAKTKIQNLSGDDRYGHILVSAGGLSRVVVVKQVEEFLNDQFGTISLTVKEYTRDDDWDVTSTTELGTYKNYWDFIRGRDDGNPLYGINPENMGGKIRTEGFHAPMSDFLQFVYTFTLPNETSSSAYSDVSWRVELAEGYEDKLLFWNGPSSPEGSGVTINTNPTFLKGDRLEGQSFTFTNSLLEMQKPGTGIITDAYRYGKDAFRIVLTNNNTKRTTTLSYDLYHTGVFNYDDGKGTRQTGGKNDQGWYYYEVIQMGNNYWLDRNLGAKSSGYYMQDGDGNSLLGNGDWPLSNNSAGGLYSIADAPTGTEPNIIDDICPKGFRIPYMSEYNALVADPKFHNEYIVNTGGDYWCSYYESDKGTVYFPKNRMYYGGQAAGDANAGYYWTRTAALGASGSERGYWLQFMKFSGSNASAGRYRIWQDESSPNGMSVRCVYASRVVERSYNIEFYVKGYTHVFLYNDEGNGKRTFLNSWPGDMIAIYDDSSLDMYHTFAYSSVTEYNNLKVVFNIVDNSGKVTSYPTDYDTNGGVPFDRDTNNNKFFHKGGGEWTSTAQ